MKFALPALFLLTAILYASVGFGGGSTYTALLVLSGAPIALIPILSLACNITVVSGNSVQYVRRGLVRFARIWPFLILSVPMAWIGGHLHIPRNLFIGLLALSLLCAGISLLLKQGPFRENAKGQSIILNALIGGGLGFISGMVGIGGGIFLAPILHHMGWGKGKEIAALCSLFILVNSLSGLTGQLMKFGDLQQLQILQPYWLLLPTVLIGGFIGNRLSFKMFSENMIRKTTALLILFVAIRLLWQIALEVF